MEPAKQIKTGNVNISTEGNQNLFPLQSEWINKFKDNWYKTNDIGLLSKKEIKELWDNTERTITMVYQYQRRAFEKKLAEWQKQQIADIDKPAMRWVKVSDETNPPEKGWYLLRSPNALPKAVGRSWFDGSQWKWGDTAKRYLCDNKEIEWLDENSSELISLQEENKMLKEALDACFRVMMQFTPQMAQIGSSTYYKRYFTVSVDGEEIIAARNDAEKLYKAALQSK